MRFPDQPRVVITGAAGGLGRALARRLADREARILVTDVRVEAAEAVALEVQEQGGEALAVELDVRNAGSWEAARDRILEAWGGIDVLVNNAGVAAVGRVGDIPLDDWRWQLEINLWGTILGCHTFVPHLKTDGGYILNVSSSAGLLSPPDMAPYNTSKAAIISLSETLHEELRQHKVVTTVLCPSFFRSQLHERIRSSDPSYARLASRFVEGASWSADDIAVVGLQGLENGELYVIPQLDGQVMWRLKRTLGPEALQRMLSWFRSSKWLRRQVRSWSRRGAPSDPTS